MKKWLFGLLALLTVPASAQQVRQQGNATGGHVPVWIAPGVIGDGGSAAGGGTLTSLGVTNNGGPGICLNSAPVTGPYNQICLSATTNGGTKISSYAINGATTPSMVFDINGVVNTFAATVALCPSGFFLGGTGVSTPLSCQTVSNAAMATMLANTTKCNPTGSTATAQDCTSKQTQTVLNSTQCFNITSSQFAGAGDNTTDNVTPLTNALAALSGTGGCIYFPPGKYKFTTNVSYSIPAGIFSVALIGAGQDNTILTWPSGSGGITINYAGINSSAHVRDLSFTTGTTNGGNALTLNMASSIGNPAITANSDIYRVTMRGDDGYALTDYWSTGLNITNVSNVNVDSLMVNGSSGQLGQGISVTGLPGSSTFAVVLNVAKSTFNNLATGLLYGSFVQGVTVDQSNFTFVGNGIGTAGGETGALVQLSVTNSQFGLLSGSNNNGIIIQTAVGSVQLANNMFVLGGTNQNAVNLANYKHFSFTGNQVQGIGSTTSNGFVIGTAGSSSPGTIVGNEFFGFSGGTGLWLQSNSTNVTVQGNTFVSNGNNIVNQGTTNIIANNQGYNPVGISSPTPGASPWTYTAGASPETVYPRASTNITNITLSGTSILAANIAAGIPATIELGPNESVIITYTGTLTMPRSIH